MPTRDIQIEDNLEEWVKNAIDDVRDALLEYLKRHPDLDEVPDLYNKLDYDGRIHEIIDGSVPIYTSDIRDAFYLHGDEIEEAFDNAGIGEKTDEGWPMGWKAAAIYCYIEQKVQEWYHRHAVDIFNHRAKLEEASA